MIRALLVAGALGVATVAAAAPANADTTKCSTDYSIWGTGQSTTYCDTYSDNGGWNSSSTYCDGNGNCTTH